MTRAGHRLRAPEDRRKERADDLFAAHHMVTFSRIGALQAFPLLAKG